MNQTLNVHIGLFALLHHYAGKFLAIQRFYDRVTGRKKSYEDLEEALELGLKQLKEESGLD